MRRRRTFMYAPNLTAVAAVCVLLGGCGSQSVSADVARPAASATTETESPLPPAHPAPPKSYRFVLTSSCGERGLLGDYDVTVRGEQVTEVKNLNRGYPYQPELTEIPTLSDLADRAESAPVETVVEFVVDDDGLPRSLSLDPIPNAGDDEECYRVSDLEILP